MEHPEEDIILYDDEEKYDDVINEGGVDCIGVLISSRDRESIPVERLELQRDNEK